MQTRIQKTGFGRSAGFTLIEILMAIVIIGILSTVALRSVQNNMESSRIRATQDEMDALKNAIAGNPDLYANGMRSDFGYVGDIGAVPSSLDDLVTNPGGYATWNGPYIARRFTEDTDGFKKDAWGNTYSFASGITISSTGGGSTSMTTNVASSASDLTTTDLTGSITDAAGNPPGDSAVAIIVIVTYPNGSGGVTTMSANPSSGGGFNLSGLPVGIHQIEAVYRATDDTVTAFAAFLPKDGATVGLRLPGAPFASGGAGPTGGIEYVSGTADSYTTATYVKDSFSFDIINNGSSSVTITSLSATYSPSAWYRRIIWNSSTVFEETNPRAGTGDVAPFTVGQNLGAGATVTVALEYFDDNPYGGSDYEISNTDFTITFSDGSTINLNSGT